MKIVDEAEMMQVKEYVKKKHPLTVSIEEKLDILILQAKIRHEHERASDENSSDLSEQNN